MKRRIFLFIQILSRCLCPFLLGYGISSYIRHEQYIMILVLSVFFGLLYIELKRNEK